MRRSSISGPSSAQNAPCRPSYGRSTPPGLIERTSPTRRSNCTCVCTVATIVSSTPTMNSRTRASGVSAVALRVTARRAVADSHRTELGDIDHDVLRRAQERNGSRSRGVGSSSFVRVSSASSMTARLSCRGRSRRDRCSRGSGRARPRQSAPRQIAGMDKQIEALCFDLAPNSSKGRRVAVNICEQSAAAGLHSAVKFFQ